MKKINIETWKRKSQYNLFKDYDFPFFSVTANLNVTKLYDYCKENELSFFLASLYLSQKTINQIENFGYRIIENEVFYFENIKIGTTVLYDDNTFGFVYFDFLDNLHEFCKVSRKVIDENSIIKGVNTENKINVIRYSVLPWVTFSSVMHPRKIGDDNSIPVIVFGKFTEENNKKTMPVSVDAHHSLMDGYHVGQYFNIFQKEIDKLDLRF